MKRNNRSRGWRGWLRFTGAAAVLATAMLVQPSEAEALPECAAYVSGPESIPAFGALVGSMTVQECALVQGGIPGTGGSYERCLTYEVGYYAMGNGKFEQLDCRDYTVWNG